MEGLDEILDLRRREHHAENQSCICEPGSRSILIGSPECKAQQQRFAHLKKEGAEDDEYSAEAKKLQVNPENQPRQYESMFTMLAPKEVEPDTMSSELRDVSDEPPHIPIRDGGIIAMDEKDSGENDIDTQGPSQCSRQHADEVCSSIGSEIGPRHGKPGLAITTRVCH